MKKFLILFMLFAVNLFGQDELLLKSASAYTGVMNGNANTKALSSNAKAIVIFPSVKKVGLIIGGMYGDGVIIYKNGAVHGAEISNASLGLQVGYEDSSLVIFVMSDKILESMRKSQIALGADATAVALDKHADVGRINVFNSDTYVYTSKSGIFAGASLGGVVLSTKNSVQFSPNTYGYKALKEVIKNGGN